MVSSLVFEHHPRNGEHIRVWRHGDGRFSCEHIMPTGKRVSIPCDTLNEAIGFWERLLQRKRFWPAVRPAFGRPGGERVHTEIRHGCVL